MKAADPAGAQRLRARALARLDALVGTGRCGFRVRPVIPIADDLACPPGPATLRPVHPTGIPLDLASNHRSTTGRLSSSDLTVDQPTVSRQHAVMFQHGGAWYVADTNSTNGTFVNRVPVVGRFDSRAPTRSAPERSYDCASSCP